MFYSYCPAVEDLDRTTIHKEFSVSYLTFNLVTFVFCLVLALVLLYQSWINLVKKRLTRFSLDAAILAYIRFSQGEKGVQKARRLFNSEPNRLRVLGIWALISGVLLMYLSVDSYLRFIP
jgi:hypothetical protein